MNKYVSVYGTLRQGERANYMLDKCKFIGVSEEQLPFKMVNLGSYPALIPSDNNNKIVIETYKLPKDSQLIEDRLDMYEGYSEDGNGLYDKKLITLKSGIESYIYYMKSEEKYYHGELIISGNWLNR